MTIHTGKRNDNIPNPDCNAVECEYVGKVTGKNAEKLYKAIEEYEETKIDIKKVL